RLGLQAALLGAGVVVLLSAAAVLVVVHGQYQVAVDELRIAAIRADGIDDPPAWTALAIHGPPGDRRTGADPTLPAGLPDLAALVADSGRLADILGELLLAADPGVERVPQPIELSELARDVVASAAAHAADRRITLIGPAADVAPVAVAGLPIALRRAVTA